VKKRLLVSIFVIAGLLAIYNNISWFLKYIYPLRFEEHIVAYSEEYDVDPYLVAAMIKVESGYSPEVQSHQGAVGLMQIMPPTAHWAADNMGIEDFHIADLKEVETNIHIGTWYISTLLSEFDGDTTLALAAYNGGIGNVRKWMASGEWNEGSVEDIPFGETRDFISKVQKAYTWYRRLYNLGL